jgi:hypothetical protein
MWGIRKRLASIFVEAGRGKIITSGLMPSGPYFGF